MERFLRTELLLGKERMQCIHNARVTIIGLGAVGSYALEALARSGVGAFRLIDFDVIEKTNINRQLLAFESTLGHVKVDVAKQRILEINPKAKVEVLPVFASEDNIDGIFDNNPDVVIDAIDSLNSKVQILCKAYERKIPVVSSMGAALRTDLSSIKTDDLFKTKGCPLAKFVRKRLRRRGIHSGIMCVYSSQTHSKAWQEPNSKNDECACKINRGRPRKSLGSLPTITGIFGLMIAHCALECICGRFNNIYKN